MNGSSIRGSVLLCAVLVLLPVVVSGVAVPNDASGDSPHASAVAVNKTTKIIDISNEKTSIYLSSQRVTIDNGEQARLEFSAVNYVTNGRPMTVQLIFQAPSGVSVTSVDDVEEGDNQYVATRSLEPGGEFGTRITIDPEEPGEYPVTAKAVYYFGTNRSNGEGKAVELEVTHRPPPKSSSEKVVSGIASTPSNLFGGLTESLPAEYAPMHGTPPARGDRPVFVFRFNLVYAFIDFLLLTLLLFGLLEMNEGDTDANLNLASVIAAVLTPILLVIGLTRLTLLVSIGLVLLIIGVFIALLVLSTFI